MKLNLYFPKNIIITQKKALFTNNIDTYEVPIINNKCDIPSQVLDVNDIVVIGVYAYEIDGEELVKRYSPSPISVSILEGSYKNAIPGEEITPTQFEQYQQALNSGLEELNNSVETFNTMIINGDFKGEAGKDGEKGEDATINGITTLNIIPGENITINQHDETLEISSEGGLSVVSHAELIDLDYENSGHTGFASEEEIVQIENDINAISNSVDKFNSDLNIINTDLQTVKSEAENAYSLAKQANKAKGYNDYQSLINELNNNSSELYNVGQSFLIITLNVPDLWISSVNHTSSYYQYTSDADLVNELKINGYVQIGYYNISMLETLKQDLTNYETKEEHQEDINNINQHINDLNELIGYINTELSSLATISEVV